MKNMYVERFISMDDDEGLDSLYDVKCRYCGSCILDNFMIGHIWKDENDVERILVDDEDEDRVIVYIVIE